MSKFLLNNSNVLFSKGVEELLKGWGAFRGGGGGRGGGCSSLVPQTETQRMINDYVSHSKFALFRLNQFWSEIRSDRWNVT